MNNFTKSKMMRGYKWKPIERLSNQEREIDLAALHPLYQTWKAAKKKLQQTSPVSLKSFTGRLVRRLSVETGILERLYDLDRGTTEALVASGFAEDIISRSSTDIEPSRLIDFLQDHEAAIYLVMDCVASKRELTKGVIHELHVNLTRHQDTTTAVDQFGKRLETPLLKGKYKQQPNNPKRPDGTVHEYCPPLQVEAEMEKLLTWLKDYSDADPVIVAAWFHHRFTQIHPYQDGNGRVGRALITLILLQAELLPLVIDRDLRVEYISALEKADTGDLAPLALLFARLERGAILQALSIDIDAEVAQEPRLTSKVIENIAVKLDRKRQQKDTNLRRVNELAEKLRGRASRFIERALAQLEQPLSQLTNPSKRTTEGGPEKNNAHWYKHEVVKLANPDGKFVNFDEAHYFVKASMQVDLERFVFVTSFHHIGRELSGIMEATAFARLEFFKRPDDRERVSQEFFPCSMEPFVFTYQTKAEDIITSFDQWLDAAIAVGIKEFGDRL